MEEEEESRINEKRAKRDAEEEEITREELVEQLKKLKKGKAPGENGIKNEA